jgi:hypothetical protein
MSAVTSSPFQMSPISTIQQAQHFFSSENFVGGFEILRNCFEESEVSNDTIFEVLKGKLGFNINGDNIEFDAKFIQEDEEQEEYAQLISEVLENYDFLIDIEHTKYQVNSSFEFDLSLIASTNDWIKELKSSEGTLVSKSDFKYFKEVMALMQEAGAYHFDEAEHILYNKGVFYTFKRYDLALITEIVNIFEKPLDAVLKYQKVQDSY